MANLSLDQEVWNDKTIELFKQFEDRYETGMVEVDTLEDFLEIPRGSIKVLNLNDGGLLRKTLENVIARVGLENLLVLTREDRIYFPIPQRAEDGESVLSVDLIELPQAKKMNQLFQMGYSFVSSMSFVGNLLKAQA